MTRNISPDSIFYQLEPVTVEEAVKKAESFGLRVVKWDIESYALIQPPKRLGIFCGDLGPAALCRYLDRMFPQ